MAAESDTGSTGELSQRASEAHALISEAARLCVKSGCSSAEYAPDKIAGAVESGRLSPKGASAIAGKFTACPGLTQETLQTTTGEEYAITLCHRGDEPQPEQLSKIERIKLDLDIRDAKQKVEKRREELTRAESDLEGLLAKRRSIYGN